MKLFAAIYNFLRKVLAWFLREPCASCKKSFPSWEMKPTWDGDMCAPCEDAYRTARYEEQEAILLDEEIRRQRRELKARQIIEKQRK